MSYIEQGGNSSGWFSELGPVGSFRGVHLRVSEMELLSRDEPFAAVLAQANVIEEVLKNLYRLAICPGWVVFG